MKRALLSLVGALCAANAAAQFPLSAGPAEPSLLAPIGGEPGIDALRVELQRGRLAAIAGRESMTLTGVPLPDGSVVDLDLVRIRHERLKFAFTVDDVARPDLLRGLDLSLWKGTVRGAVGSEVQLSFARTGAQGWIRRGDRLVHVLPRPDARGNWTRGDALLVDESVLNALGMRFDGTCAATEAPGRATERGSTLARIPRDIAPSSGGQQALGSSCGLRECRIAITSDFQYFQKWNDLAAQTAYTTTLLGFVSDRYETQASTILTFPSVAFYTTAADPWAAQDTGGNCQAVLTELQAAWVGAVPAGADLGHLMSGANLGCGVAWLDVLCDPQFNFSVSGNLNGTIAFPIVQQPNNWDFIVVSHEIGHNFDALHTHDYCPPLDQCAPSGYFGQCQTAQVCTNQGSIMSYCHLCSGGTANITTFFHPTSAADMTLAAAACLPLASGITATVPTLVAPNTPAPVSTNVTGTPVFGSVLLRWRPNASTPYAGIGLVNQGGGLYTGLLPGFACGDVPSFYLEVTDTSCGILTDPPGAPANTFALDVAALATTYLDTFQTDQGWAATNLGATSGDWQRGVPVNDSGWAYDPAADGDGSGSCWLTQNAPGNTDVDGGAVQLLSPSLDLSSPGVTVEYLYFLRLTAGDGSDSLRVEVSANGAAGPWVTLVTHSTDGGLAWRSARFERADFLAAGVSPGATARLRFTATDAGAGNIVEAGLDGFRVSQSTCTVVGASFCLANPNSSGSAAQASATGSASVAANDLVLRAQPVPANANGIFYFGPNVAQTPFGNGWRCVGGSTFRLGIVSASGGALTRAVNNTLPPAAGRLVPGSTWNFQAWFRDAAAGGAQFNLSNGLRIPFAP
ncbi:MAG: M12 family metallo-peptidase [Planctomycetota bacterium]|nr:M12 family metallo-peptidase [Planctomycetota bacterium]